MGDDEKRAASGSHWLNRLPRLRTNLRGIHITYQQVPLRLMASSSPHGTSASSRRRKQMKRRLNGLKIGARMFFTNRQSWHAGG